MNNNFYNIEQDGTITRKDGIPLPESMTMKDMCEEIIKADFSFYGWHKTNFLTAVQ